MTVQKLLEVVDPKVLAILPSARNMNEFEESAKESTVPKIDAIRELNSTWNERFVQVENLSKLYSKQVEHANETVLDLEKKLEKSQKMLEAEKSNMAVLTSQGASNATKTSQLLFAKDKTIVNLEAEKRAKSREIKILESRLGTKEKVIENLKKEHLGQINQLNDTCQADKALAYKKFEDQINETKAYLAKERNITSQLKQHLQEEINLHANTSHELGLLDSFLSKTDEDWKILKVNITFSGVYNFVMQLFYVYISEKLF